MGAAGRLAASEARQQLQDDDGDVCLVRPLFKPRITQPEGWLANGLQLRRRGCCILPVLACTPLCTPCPQVPYLQRRGNSPFPLPLTRIGRSTQTRWYSGGILASWGTAWGAVGPGQMGRRPLHCVDTELSSAS